MDIDQLYTVDDHADGAEMRIVDTSGKKTDMYITLVGCDSVLWAQALSKLRKTLMSLPEDDNGEGKTEANAEAMACASLGWRGFTNKGKALKFSKAKVKQLYINAPYIRDMADLFIAKRVNFTKGKASK